MPHRRTKAEQMEEREMYLMREAKPPKKLPAMHLESRKRYVGGAVGVKQVHHEMDQRHHAGAAPHPRDGQFKSGKSSMRHDGHQGPQATSVPGAMNIIHDVQKQGRGIHGVPGIISSTTLGPEVRQRLVAGIIEHPMAGEAASGPVHHMKGYDATAYNAGMAHIAGSRFK